MAKKVEKKEKERIRSGLRAHTGQIQLAPTATLACCNTLKATAHIYLIERGYVVTFSTLSLYL